MGLHPSLRGRIVVRRPHRRPEGTPTNPQRRTRRNLYRATETRAPYLFGGIRNCGRSAESRATAEALEWCEEGSSGRTGHIRAEAPEWLSAAKEALTGAKAGHPSPDFELRLASHVTGQASPGHESSSFRHARAVSPKREAQRRTVPSSIELPHDVSGAPFGNRLCAVLPLIG